MQQLEVILLRKLLTLQVRCKGVGLGFVFFVVPPVLVQIHMLRAADFDPTNTTLFIGGLSSTVSEEQLRALFSKYATSRCGV